ncbi:MAG: hypothetical protein V7K38_23080 [Nostoc sp.]
MSLFYVRSQLFYNVAFGDTMPAAGKANAQRENTKNPGETNRGLREK